MTDHEPVIDQERWKARFRAARVGLPEWAADAPARSFHRSNASGTWEIHARDESTGTTRQVTHRANGTLTAAIDPAGDWLWWFADADGGEYGVWMRQPFDGGDDEPAVPGLEPAYPAGLALGSSGLAVVGGTVRGGTAIHLCVPGKSPTVLYRHEQDAWVAALSRDESLIAIGHSEAGDSRHPAVRVLRPDGTVVADLADGPGLGVRAGSFSPSPGEALLLVEHERRGRPEPLLWDVLTGRQEEILLDLPGELTASWYPDGSALLITHTHHARHQLYRYDLAHKELTRLPTPRGVIAGAAARPDGTVAFAWTDAASPPVIRSTSGSVLLTPPGPTPPSSVPVEDLWVDGPGGPIHVLISRPPGGERPHPCLFDVHGGPAGWNDDSYNPPAAVWVDQGFLVVHLNFRGSTGYGSRWRDAIEGRPGLTELEDVHAVRDRLVADGIADPARMVLSGRSWGGYLTLLGLGLRPEAWTLGFADAPIADYLTAYRDETEMLRAYDRSLFGGSPDEVPERYRRSSPLSYAERVRVPVMILAGENDPRCPIRQIDRYVERLGELGKECRVYRYDAGHGSLVAEERIRQTIETIDFVGAHITTS
ncbi:prolyl oligopeptidase family serine peptidase [Kitasatospora sp. NPDC058444]|uniref:prolyl oligopeptidase family serine peptidase n=1 Tax=Kitasatospora sp. NPDC058444 TaxID=3346504 RepID=UPI003669F33D